MANGYMFPDQPMSPFMQAMTSPSMGMAMEAANNFQRLHAGQQVTNPVARYQKMVMERAQANQAQRQAEQLQKLRDLQMRQAQRQLEAPPEREIREDQYGVARYIDDGSPVFPGVTAPERSLWTVESIQDEYDLSKFTPESVETALGTLNPSSLVPKEETFGFDETGKLRTEFQKYTSDFRTQQDAFGRVLSSAREPSAAGDLALIFNYMKVLDPGSTVREGEAATAESARGVGEEVRGLYNRLLRGERLTAPQRADFVKRASMLYEGSAGSFENRANEYRTLAQAYEIDPSRVVLGGIQYPRETYEELLQATQDAMKDAPSEDVMEMIDEATGQRWRRTPAGTWQRWVEDS